MNTFSISSFIKSSWVIFKKHWKFIILAGLATAVIDIVLQFAQRAFQGSTHPSHVVVSLIISLISILVTIIISLGWSQVLLSLIRKDQASWSTFETDPVVWLRLVKVIIWYILYLAMYLFAALVLFGILAVIAMIAHVHWLFIVGALLAYIAFIVYAVYFAIRYQFISYAVLDYPELSSRKIFKKAGEITAGYRGDLFGFLIVLGLLNLVGFAFIIAAFVLVFIPAHSLVMGLLSFIFFVIGIGWSLGSIPVTKIAKAKAYDVLKNIPAHTATVISSNNS